MILHLAASKPTVKSPLLSCLKALFQSEAKCEAIDMKMIFYSHVNKTYFYHKGFAVSLVLKVRVFGACKGPTGNNEQIQLGYYATLFSL